LIEADMNKNYIMHKKLNNIENNVMDDFEKY
jgi:hypothetical protein